MKFPKPIAIKKIAEEYHCKVLGNPEQLALGINVIHSVEVGDITFVDVEKYYSKSLNSAATVILIDKEVDPPKGKSLLVTANPFGVYDAIIAAHRPMFTPTDLVRSQNIHSSAIIEPGVEIKECVSIGANSYVGANSYLGSYTSIGTNVIIEPNSVIGSDAFYYKKEDGQYVKWTSGGVTIIEDHVEVGAGSTINKGVSSSTVIGAGTKIDCQVHIGHGCRIGTNCLIAAQVGIGGKTRIGNNAVLYGQVGIAQNLVIGDDVIILAKSGVSKNLASGKTYFGYPAGEVFQKNRELAGLRQLPELIKKMK